MKLNIHSCIMSNFPHNVHMIREPMVNISPPDVKPSEPEAPGSNPGGPAMVHDPIGRYELVSELNSAIWSSVKWCESISKT